MSRQIKLCPKCGTENKPENASCANCYTTLSSVPTTLSTKPEPTASPAATPTAGPTRETPAANPMGGMPGGPIGGYTPSPRPQKSSSGGGAIGWIIGLLLLGGLVFAGWWFFMKPMSPDMVVKEFLAAADAKDANRAIACLSKSSIELMGGEEKLRQQAQKSTSMGIPGQASKSVNVGAVTYEGENTAVVDLTPTASAAKTMPSMPGMQTMKFQIVTIREDGKWKIDMMQTGARMMGQMMKSMPAGGMPHGRFTPPAGGAPPSMPRP